MASSPRPSPQTAQPGAQRLLADLRDARARTLELVRDLSGEQLLGPRLDIVNPPLWEIGHVAWFHEHFILQGLDHREPILPDADSLYDSMKVAHATRWDLPLPDLEGTLAYLRAVEEALVARLERRAPAPEDAYRYRLTTFHEDMHGEALAYTRQTLGYPAPRLIAASEGVRDFGSGALAGDAAVPGGAIQLGSTGEEPFAFDNEKWAHAVEIDPFRIARAPVTCAEFLAFVEDGGYRRRGLWTGDGWRWRVSAAAGHPVYWRNAGGGWQARVFGQWACLPAHQPVVHVNWYEADAWCRWAGRRLPSEAEWEAAAAGEPSGDGRSLAPRKRRYPWGDAPPTPARANLDGRRVGCSDVAAHPAGDSAFGCRQMLGNVWEWTASAFVPYPGFAPDAYAEYSQPWFGTHKVLRGGCWTTRSRMLTATYRNFFTPERRDVFAGFRSCAL